MQIMVRDVNKIAAVLRKDSLLKSIVRDGSRDERPFHRTYYYLELSHFIDVVKLRLHLMRKTLDDRIRNEANEKGYYCPRCNRNYKPLDALKYVDPRGHLLCETCSGELQSVDSSMLSTGTLSQSRLIEQTDSILRLLKRLDDATLQPFDPEGYLKQRESFEIVERDAALKMAGSDASRPLQVEIISEKGKGLGNEMPEWHSHSTITGKQVNLTCVSSLLSAGMHATSAPSLTANADTYVKSYEANASYDNLSKVKRPKMEQEPEISTSVKKPQVMIAVQGVLKNIYEITDADKDLMTEEEYIKYFEEFQTLDQ